MPDDRLSQLRKGYAEEDYLGLEPPDLGPLRMVAEAAEFAEATGRLGDAYGRPMSASDPRAARPGYRPGADRGGVHPASLRAESSAVPAGWRLPGACCPW